LSDEVRELRQEQSEEALSRAEGVDLPGVLR
jgi:hypothetical protein